MATPPRYIYQRTGGPLVTWDRMRPPAQTRAADTLALGSLGDADVFDKPRRLPRGGAPEYIMDGFGDTDVHKTTLGPRGRGMGCSCQDGVGCDDCGDSTVKHAIIGSGVAITAIHVLAGIGAYAVLKKLFA